MASATLQSARPQPARPIAERGKFVSALAEDHVSVNRGAGIVAGCVICEARTMFTPGRGRFDLDGCESVKKCMQRNRGGTKCRMQHPNVVNDRLEWYVGVFVSPYLSTAATPLFGIVDCVRANLVLSASARISPNGDLVAYVLERAENDAMTFGTSLVLDVDKQEPVVNGRRQPALDDKGNLLPPRWIAKSVLCCDLVDCGDATSSLLSPLGETQRMQQCNLVRKFEGLPPLDIEHYRAEIEKERRHRKLACLELEYQSLSTADGEDLTFRGSRRAGV